MRAFYCDEFVLPLPEGHRFPMEKYRLLRERVTEYADVDLEVPDAVPLTSLGRVHTQAYLDAVTGGGLDRGAVRAIGFPWSLGPVERSRRSVGGTLAAARAARADGASVNLAGGPLALGPDIAFYVAGADPFVDDRLGRLAVSRCDGPSRSGVLSTIPNLEGVHEVA